MPDLPLKERVVNGLEYHRPYAAHCGAPAIVLPPACQFDSRQDYWATQEGCISAPDSAGSHRKRANVGAEFHLVAFDQTSARDVIEKLRREIDRIESLAERDFAKDHVMNAFSTAWHIHEWLWDTIKDEPELKAAVLKYRGIDETIDDHQAFGLALARRFVPLKICRVIATSSKHLHVIVSSESREHDGAEFQAFDVIGGGLSGTTQDPSVPALSAVRCMPAVIIMGRRVAAARLLAEIDDYWVTLIEGCGIEHRQ
jgi:hypothetical protein